MMNDQEIMEKLKSRSTDDLVSFQKKLKRIETPEAWAIRFHLIRELLSRIQAGTE